MFSDGLHNLSDGAALIIAFWAEYMKLQVTIHFVTWRYATLCWRRFTAHRCQAKTDRMTYGWKRSEVLGGLFNGTFLLSMCMFVVLEAIPRFISPEGSQHHDQQHVLTFVL